MICIKLHLSMNPSGHASGMREAGFGIHNVSHGGNRHLICKAFLAKVLSHPMIARE